MPQTIISLHRKHGPLVRTGPAELSVADLSAIKKIYGPGTKFRKGDWYSVWYLRGGIESSTCLRRETRRSMGRSGGW